MNSFTAGSSQEFCLDFKLFISIFEILQITYVPELLSMACSALLQNSYFGEHILVAASVNIYCFHFAEWATKSPATTITKKILLYQHYSLTVPENNHQNGKQVLEGKKRQQKNK